MTDTDALVRTLRRAVDAKLRRVIGDVDDETVAAMFPTV
jgi:hypothetical protein